MAGDEKATYLATPMSSRASYFCSNAGKETESTEKIEKPKQDSLEEEQQTEENTLSTEAQSNQAVTETAVQDH